MYAKPPLGLIDWFKPMDNFADCFTTDEMGRGGSLIPQEGSKEEFANRDKRL